MTTTTYRRIDAPRYASMIEHDCAECGHEALTRPVFLDADGATIAVGTGCAERLTGRAAAEWDADLAADWVASATFGALNAWSYLAMCMPGRVTAKFRGEIVARGADEATADAAIAAYRALARVGAVRSWKARATTGAATSHDGHELIVSGGVVRCTDCMEWLHDHPDSRPARGLIARNQER